MIRVFRPIPVESIKLLVFDLDGTLIDSAQDLCNSVNATLTHFGRPPLPDATIAGYIGNGALLLVRRAFAADDGIEPDEETLAKGYAFFLDYYREHKLDYTYAYEGVLRRSKLSATCTTSSTSRRAPWPYSRTNPSGPRRPSAKASAWPPTSSISTAATASPPRNPIPKACLALMREANARPDQTVMIGDSQVDVQTARNAGAWSIGCTFGLAPGSLEAIPPDVLVDSPADWTAALSPAKVNLEP